MFRGGRPLFHGGQAPSGPSVIRPLFPIQSCCACQIWSL